VYVRVLRARVRPIPKMRRIRRICRKIGATPSPFVAASALAVSRDDGWNVRACHPLPAFKRFSLIVNATDPFRRPLLEWTQRGAAQLGLDMNVSAVKGVDELAGAFEDVVGKVDAVLIQPSLPVHRAAELALAHHLPSASPTRGFVKAGGLLSYCANYSEIWHEMAVYVGKILKGAKPADLPVEQPTKFELSVNLKTADTLGLTIPAGVLGRADDVIE
jgi:putative ABC transport system substrate-binding protein